MHHQMPPVIVNQTTCMKARRTAPNEVMAYCAAGIATHIHTDVGVTSSTRHRLQTDLSPFHGRMSSHGPVSFGLSGSLVYRMLEVMEVLWRNNGRLRQKSS